MPGAWRGSAAASRIVAWPLDAATGMLAESSGKVRGFEAHVTGQTQVQGALSVNGAYCFSASEQDPDSYGRLYRNEPDYTSTSTPWLLGPEDLTYQRDTNRIWSNSEFAGALDVVGLILPQP